MLRARAAAPSSLLRRSPFLSASPAQRSRTPVHLSVCRSSASLGKTARSFAFPSKSHSGVNAINNVAREVQHDRALCTTLGVVSGGVAVTALLSPSTSDECENDTVNITAAPTGSALLDRIVNWYRDYEQDDFFWGWSRDIRRQVRQTHTVRHACHLRAHLLTLCIITALA